MTINSLKDLEKLIKLCQKTGVLAVKANGIELQLGVKPHKPSRPPRLEDPLASVSVPTPNLFDPVAFAKAQAAKATAALKEQIEMPDELSDEQLLMYSARQEPGTE